MVYLDCCGSLFERMREELGAAFSQRGIPTVETTYFSSPAERLAVRFGPENLVITQQWVSTPVRVEQIAAKAWPIVADALKVKGNVSRAGMRFMMQWAVESGKEAQSAMSRVVPASEQWSKLVGPGSMRNYVTVQMSPVDGSRTRTELSLAQNLYGELPPSLVGKVPALAVQLDVDYVLPGSVVDFDPFTVTSEKTVVLSPDNFRRFMRSSWESMETAVTELAKAAEL
jgi:hypothetical protein